MMANALSRKNLLSKISGNGEWLFEDANIKEGVSRAFQNLL